MSVRHALLALLSEGPKYGLQLRDEFEHRTGEVWPLNVGQVYTTLQRLERDGLIESDGEEEAGPQKSFRITTDGTSELQAYLEVQNVTNRQNTEEFVYSPDFTRRGQIQSLPILPVAGLQWTF